MHQREGLAEVEGHGHVPPPFLERVAFVVLVAYCVEMVLGGPGYWAIGPVRIRQALFLLLLLALTLLCVGRRYRFQPGSVVLILAVSLLLGVWMLLIPAASDLRRLPLAFADAAAFLIIPVAVLAYEFLRRNERYWQPLLRSVLASLVLVACANIALWLLGTTDEAGNELAQAIALDWFTLGRGTGEPPLYIGVMPDGFFRAMWITAILYVPAVLFAVARRQWWLALLMAAALFVCYTRSLWLVTVAAIVFAQVLAAGRAFVSARAVAVALVLCALAAGILEGTGAGREVLDLSARRVQSTFSDGSAQERFEQVAPLLLEWERSPLWGAGFGASATMVRSENAPYSYELVGLALLMKLGVVGIAYFLVCFGLVWRTCLPGRAARTPEQCAALASSLALVGAGLSNPLVLNSVGMSTLGLLFVFLVLGKEAADWSHGVPEMHA